MSDITRKKVKQPTIIANPGVSDRGKSKTVKDIYNEIRNIYPHAVEIRPTKITGDISALLNINGAIVGIESEGDPGWNSRLFESLDEFERAKCDIIICVCRTKGSTYDRVVDFKDRLKYRLIWAQNMRTSTVAIHNPLNKHYVDIMVKVFDDIIRGIM